MVVFGGAGRNPSLPGSPLKCRSHGAGEPGHYGFGRCHGGGLGGLSVSASLRGKVPRRADSATGFDLYGDPIDRTGGRVSCPRGAA